MMLLCELCRERTQFCRERIYSFLIQPCYLSQIMRQMRSRQNIEIGTNNMYKINVNSSFSAAHYLDNYSGACKYLHGHNWKVRLQLTAQNTDEIGMAIDFKLVKDNLNMLLDRLDHKHLNELEFFSNLNPTSENIAQLIYREMQSCFENDNIKISEVEIWESENNSVIYCGM